LQPVVIRPNGHGYKLVAGAHRLEAFKRLDRDTIPANVVRLDDLDAQLAEIDENLVRSELTALQQAQQLKRRKEWYEAKYPQTKRGTAGADARWNATADSAVASFVEDTATKTGVSQRVVYESVQIATDIAPEVQEILAGTDVADNKSELSKIAKMPEEMQKAVAEKIASGEARTVVESRRQVIRDQLPDVPVPTGKYRVLYADPPWEYGNTQPDYHPEQRDHYRTMTMKELCEMPVADLAEDNAVLFLWVTSPILREAFDLIEAWGFGYKTSFVWDKIKHNMGHYNSVRHEFLLVCVRGSCQPDVRKLFDSVVTEERTEHSAKPESFRQIIDTIYPKGRRIELFARKRVEGWDVYGNQA
jgi:N6-adenosine-specific RNA methylase IME4